MSSRLTKVTSGGILIIPKVTPNAVPENNQSNTRLTIDFKHDSIRCGSIDITQITPGADLYVLHSRGEGIIFHMLKFANTIHQNRLDSGCASENKSSVHGTICLHDHCI